MIVLVICAVALFLLIMGTILPGIKPEASFGVNRDDPSSENVGN